MASIHTVSQGETLTHIAKKYKFSSWKSIYFNPANSALQKLRPDPNIIYPGDQVVIPKPVPKSMSVRTTRQHVFCIKKEREKFQLKIEDTEGNNWNGKRAVLTIANKQIDTFIDATGTLSLELPDDYESDATLDLYLEETATQPTHQFAIKLGFLDPVDTISGAQARCNLLGEDCGPVDGVMGEKTKAGLLAFQTRFGIAGDGQLNTETQQKLKDRYGC